MNLSLAAAVVPLGAKVTAAVFTGWALRLACSPADKTHHFGHDKVTFLSAGFEGAMIAAAAVEGAVK